MVRLRSPQVPDPYVIFGLRCPGLSPASLARGMAIDGP